MLAVCAFSSSDRNEMLVKAFFTEHWPICRQVHSMNGIIICQLRTLIGYVDMLLVLFGMNLAAGNIPKKVLS